MTETSKTGYYLAYGLAVASLLLCLIGFGTGYWWVTYEPENLFHSVGLWQICFNGYEHTSDLIGKAYYGCWWIFYKEYYYIRTWIMPGWFKAVQTLMTFAVVFQFLTMGILPFAGREINSVRRILVACITIWMMFFCTAISVVIFGVMVGEDRTWMPRWDMDHLGWSYGLTVVSGFLSAFSGISLTVYLCMRKYDLLANNGSDPKSGMQKRMPRI